MIFYLNYKYKVIRVTEFSRLKFTHLILVIVNLGGLGFGREGGGGVILRWDAKPLKAIRKGTNIFSCLLSKYNNAEL